MLLKLCLAKRKSSHHGQTFARFLGIEMRGVMKKKMLNLEIVTPMFLHGENSRKLEIRPPPFKSLMRYWWRTVQDCDEESLRAAESKLFGSTDGKSPFSIRMSGGTVLNSKQYKPLPHRNDNRGFQTDAYKEGQSFDLYLITKDGSDASIYEQIAKLGFLLGGIGNRSRRGFGSIRETRWNFTNVSDLRQEVLDTLNSVTGTNRFQDTGKIIKSKKRACYPPEYPVIQCIFFGNPMSNVDALLVKIGQATHNYKHDALGSANPRMASPIHVRIQKIGNKYVPVVTQLFSPYPRMPSSLKKKQQDFINAIIT